MKIVARIFVVFGLLSGIMGCGATATPAAMPTVVPTAAPTATLAAALQLTNPNTISLDQEDRTLALSPDGKWLVTTKPSGVCIIASDTFSEKTCVAFTNLDPSAVKWSPDSGRVAWTENWTLNRVDSDIWVLDVASGTLTNLTDDAFEGAIPLDDAANAVTIDSLPAWSTDGRTIYFTRSQINGVGGTSLYRVATRGGPAKHIAVLHEDVFTVGYGLFTVDDGSLLYTLFLRQRDDPDNGIWRINADGSDPQQLVKKSGEDLPIATAVRGQTVVLCSSIIGKDLPLNTSVYSVLDLKTNTVTPVKPESSAFTFTGPSAVALSPDGSKVLYTYSHEEQVVVAVRDIRDSTEHVLHTFDDINTAMLGDVHFGFGLNWASNNVIYGQTLAHHGMLAHMTP